MTRSNLLKYPPPPPPSPRTLTPAPRTFSLRDAIHDEAHETEGESRELEFQVHEDKKTMASAQRVCKDSKVNVSRKHEVPGAVDLICWTSSKGAQFGGVAELDNTSISTDTSGNVDDDEMDEDLPFCEKDSSDKKTPRTCAIQLSEFEFQTCERDQQIVGSNLRCKSDDVAMLQRQLSTANEVVMVELECGTSCIAELDVRCMSMCHPGNSEDISPQSIVELLSETSLINKDYGPSVVTMDRDVQIAENRRVQTYMSGSMRGKSSFCHSKSLKMPVAASKRIVDDIASGNSRRSSSSPWLQSSSWAGATSAQPPRKFQPKTGRASLSRFSSSPSLEDSTEVQYLAESMEINLQAAEEHERKELIKRDTSGSPGLAVNSLRCCPSVPSFPVLSWSQQWSSSSWACEIIVATTPIIQWNPGTQLSSSILSPQQLYGVSLFSRHYIPTPEIHLSSTSLTIL